jgi:hypothetical protein
MTKIFITAFIGLIVVILWILKVKKEEKLNLKK